MKANITAAELCEITDLTDRRLRQLSADGHIPKANRGIYETKPTLKALFKFYRSASDPDIKKKTAFEVWRDKKLKNDARDGRLIDRDKHDAHCYQVACTVLAVFSQKFLNELPAAAEKQEATAIRILNKGGIKAGCRELRKLIGPVELQNKFDEEAAQWNATKSTT